MEHNYANKSLTYLFILFFLIFGRNLILPLAEPPSSSLSSMASGLILIIVTVVLPVWHILLILETTGKENHQSCSYSFGISTLNLQNPCELCLYIHRCARPHIMEKWKVFLHTFTHVHPQICGVLFQKPSWAKTEKHIDALKGINTFSACKQRSAFWEVTTESNNSHPCVKHNVYSCF